MLERFLFWSPRLLALLFAGFTSIFAFGALSEGHGVHASAVHFVTSLIPTLTILATLAIAWRWEWMGAALFTGFAVTYIVVAWGRFPLTTYLIICGPMLLIAFLFIAHWQRHQGGSRRSSLHE